MNAAAVAWVFKRYRLPIIAITALSLFISLLYSMYVVKPVYRAKTVIMITSTDENTVQKFDYVNILANRQLVKPYSEIIQSSTVLERVAIELGESITADQLRSAVTVRQVGGTELIEIAALSGDPQRAAIIANETAIVFIRHVKEIFKLTNVKILESAVFNDKPVKPNLCLNIIAAVLLGFFIIVVFCLTFTYIRQPVGMPGMTDESVRFMAKVPRFNSKKNNWEKLFENKIIKNSFLYLQTLLIRKIGNAKIILLTSVADGEGKSTITQGLAFTLCQYGHKVTVINADATIINPNTPILFKEGQVRESIPETDGILEVLQTAGCPELRIVEAANPIVDIYQFLSSPAFGSLLKEEAAHSDLILINGPALSEHAEAILLATKVDGVLLVTRTRTPAEQFKKTLFSLESVQADILGVVLNEI